MHNAGLYIIIALERERNDATLTFKKGSEDYEKTHFSDVDPSADR